MINHTTPEMIDAARAIALDVAKEFGVQCAFIDDWGRFGNFSLFVYVPNSSQVSLRDVGKAVRNAVKARSSKGAHVRSMRMPTRRYRRVGSERLFDGWNSDGRRFKDHGEISIDLDFHRYDPATNKFPFLQTHGSMARGANPQHSAA